MSDAAVSLQADGLVAFYRPEKRDITIISHVDLDRGAAINALSHELTHYLQDLAGQLDQSRKRNVTLDESVARRALSEGEAVVTSYRATAAMMGLDPVALPWSAILDELEDAATSATSGSDSPLLAASYRLPYVLGASAIEAAWEGGGRERIDQLFEAPPLTQFDWLVNRPLTNASRAEELDCYPALPPAGYKAIASDSLGVAGLFALLGGRETLSYSEARAWRQDRLVIYMRDSDVDSDTPHALAVWRIRFGNEQTASLFADEIANPEFHISRFGRELLLVVSNNSDDEAVNLLDTEACPRL